MNYVKLEKCLFCQSEMIRERFIRKCKSCRPEWDGNHVWEYYNPATSEEIIAFNIVIDGYQLHIRYDMNYTILFNFKNKFSSGPNCEKDIMIKLDSAIDFPLDVEAIRKKIKMLLVFS